MNGNLLNFSLFSPISLMKPLEYGWTVLLKDLFERIPNIFGSDTLLCMECWDGIWKCCLIWDWCSNTLNVLQDLTTLVTITQNYSIFYELKFSKTYEIFSYWKIFLRNLLEFWKHKILHQKGRGILSILWPIWIYVNWSNFLFTFWSPLWLSYSKREIHMFGS